MQPVSDRFLGEGLKRHALQDLVLPLLSIDEYESKISDKRAIVVGFYVMDEDPAVDLSNFIDRGSADILDTEVSPAPTPEGNFVVFVEMSRNDDFPADLMEVLRDVDNICEIATWSFTCPGYAGPVSLTEDALRDKLVLDPNEVPDEPDEEQDTEEPDEIAETEDFWRESAVDSIEHTDDELILHKDGVPVRLRCLREGKYLGSLDPDNSDARLLEKLLGGHPYEVYAAGDSLLVTKGDHTMMVQKLP